MRDLSDQEFSLFLARGQLLDNISMFSCVHRNLSRRGKGWYLVVEEGGEYVKKMTIFLHTEEKNYVRGGERINVAQPPGCSSHLQGNVYVVCTFLKITHQERNHSEFCQTVIRAKHTLHHVISHL